MRRLARLGEDIPLFPELRVIQADISIGKKPQRQRKRYTTEYRGWIFDRSRQMHRSRDRKFMK